MLPISPLPARISSPRPPAGPDTGNRTLTIGEPPRLTEQGKGQHDPRSQTLFGRTGTRLAGNASHPTPHRRKQNKLERLLAAKAHCSQIGREPPFRILHQQATELYNANFSLIYRFKVPCGDKPLGSTKPGQLFPSAKGKLPQLWPPTQNTF